VYKSAHLKNMPYYFFRNRVDILNDTHDIDIISQALCVAWADCR